MAAPEGRALDWDRPGADPFGDFLRASERRFAGNGAGAHRAERSEPRQGGSHWAYRGAVLILIAVAWCAAVFVILTGVIH